MTKRLHFAASLSAGLTLLALGGCPPAQQQDIPNRVLDRPVDVALSCVRVECNEDDSECWSEAVSLRECRGETGSCTSTSNHLVGFVANSERNEVAIFTQCSGELVDMDLQAPGYNFIPVGELPSAMTGTSDGCRVISSNAGSCDLTVLDAPNLGAFGLGDRDPQRLVADGSRVPIEPSSLVATVVPERLDPELGWTALGARPGEILAVPKQLSSAEGFAIPDDPILDTCGPDQPGSVYVTFPSCNLVAEVDLVTHRIMQSFQFSETEEGVEVLDTGSNPVCPIDCPETLDELPEDPPTADPNGYAPVSIELVAEVFGDCPGDEECLDAADCAVEGSSLFVGGLGSDNLVEVKMGEGGVWSEEIQQVELVGAAGIEKIIVSPPMLDPTVGGSADPSEVLQFAYVIAGDGTTRVVRRDLSDTAEDIGFECDTQVDPSASGGETSCFPVTVTPVGVRPPERRAFAQGPGITAPRGARFTDWVFKKVPENINLCLNQEDIAPFLGGPGQVMAVGSTNAGRLVYSMMGQVPTPTVAGDEIGIMDVSMQWHMLKPDFLDASLKPVVEDRAVERRLPANAGPTRLLAPGLRLIDWAYLNEPEIFGDDPLRAELGAAYGNALNSEMGPTIRNADNLGGEEPAFGFALPAYTNDVVRAGARDYRAWGGSEWELVWEGSIPGASSSSGQLSCRCDCDDPEDCYADSEDDLICDIGWADATCRASVDGSSRLSDPGADFCAAGVLPGDKLVILGCSDDDECGSGQRCLSEPGGLPGSGLCVSEQAYAEDEAALREACGQFISDPCGEPHREYLITRSFEDQVYLQSLPRDPISYLALDPDAPAPPDPEEDPDEPYFPQLMELEDTFVCSQEQPENGCETDLECQELLTGTEEDDGSEFLCIEERCRKVCEGDECLLRRLPGPRCFAEFVRYEVRTHNSFVVEGQGPATFLSDHVFADPGSLSDTGTKECYDGGTEAGISTLLTSRIRIGPDDASLDLPLCEDESGFPNSGSFNPCLIESPRAGSEGKKFHRFAYFKDGDGSEAEDEAHVTAIRYSNPIMSLVLDLVDLRALGTRIPEGTREIDQLAIANDGLWPGEFRRFRRSRIPRGYRELFQTRPAYTPIDALVGIGQHSLTFPVRLISAPELDWVFAVDASGPGVSTAIRGQVLRINVNSSPPFADIGFDGVR